MSTKMSKKPTKIGNVRLLQYLKIPDIDISVGQFLNRKKGECYKWKNCPPKKTPRLAMSKIPNIDITLGQFLNKKKEKVINEKIATINTKIDNGHVILM